MGVRQIVIDPDVCNGTPTIEATRIIAQTVLQFLSAGDSVDDILEEYPMLAYSQRIANRRTDNLGSRHRIKTPLCPADADCMKLSSDLLAEITESVTIVGRDEPRPADRRSPRVKLSSHLFAFNWMNPSQPFGIRVQNLSEGGVGILHHQRIALDEKLVIRFVLRGDRELLVLGEVAYWEPLAEDLYSIGLQFDRFVDREELENPSSRQSEQASVFSRMSRVFTRGRRAAS